MRTIVVNDTTYHWRVGLQNVVIKEPKSRVTMVVSKDETTDFRYSEKDWWKGSAHIYPSDIERVIKEKW